MTLCLPYFTRGGADLPRPHAKAYTHKKSMGENSDNFCTYIPKGMAGMAKDLGRYVLAINSEK